MVVLTDSVDWLSGLNLSTWLDSVDKQRKDFIRTCISINRKKMFPPNDEVSFHQMKSQAQVKQSVFWLLYHCHLYSSIEEYECMF